MSYNSRCLWCCSTIHCLEFTLQRSLSMRRSSSSSFLCVCFSPCSGEPTCYDIGLDSSKILLLVLKFCEVLEALRTLDSLGCLLVGLKEARLARSLPHPFPYWGSQVNKKKQLDQSRFSEINVTHQLTIYLLYTNKSHRSAQNSSNFNSRARLHWHHGATVY